MITNITINNVKGFGTENNSFDVEIKAGKMTLLVAPNGFGKSSISAAFNSLNANRLNVAKEDWHIGDGTLESLLSVTFNGATYIADKNRNEIGSVFNTFVIKNRLVSTASAQNYCGRAIANAKMEVKSITIRSSIPHKASFDYKVSEISKDFGANGKLLTNLKEYIKDKSFTIDLFECGGHLDKFSNIRKKTIIDDIKSCINSKKGSKEQIQSSIAMEVFDNLFSDEEYRAVVGKMENYNPDLSSTGRFTFFYQLLHLWNHHKEVLRKCKKWSEYEQMRSKYSETLDCCDTTGNRVKIEEVKGKLILKFPNGNMISNGQRDIVTFIIQLMIFENNIREGKNNLLIIDEVFDYLDDANIVAAQYFLSNLIHNYKDKLYVVVLSHLGEDSFRSYALRNLLNVCCIKPVVAKPEEAMKVYIRFRESIRKENGRAYDDLSCYFFHYHPEAETKDFTEYYQVKQNLKKNWFNRLGVHVYLLEQLNKYLNNSNEYDPYAVCFALRLACEKKIYEQLNNEQKPIFLETKTTKKKLEKAEEMRVNVPFTYYLLGVIYNDADHLRENEQERNCVYKLDNLIIRHMVKTMFGKDVVTIADIANKQENK